MWKYLEICKCYGDVPSSKQCKIKYKFVSCRNVPDFCLFTIWIQNVCKSDDDSRKANTGSEVSFFIIYLMKLSVILTIYHWLTGL
jgi:hypothetical protein